MERLTITTGSFEVNTSILSENGRAWIVEPGGETERIISLLAKKGLQPAGIMLTHAHFDHIGAVNALQAASPELKLTVHRNDLPVITHPMNAMPPDYPPVTMPQNIVETTDAPNCEIIETPGHTPGGVCYYFPAEKLLLAGDTLFAGSVGRTDLPGGDMAVLMQSLKKLTDLPDDTLVIPGHGPHTTIGAEKTSNPFLRPI
jgi:glyoxylase-like metal-dependent hydrolase (beta-lactamase superfamily II)